MSTEDQTEVMDLPSTAAANDGVEAVHGIAAANGELSSLAGWMSGYWTEVRTFSEP